jgi:hypothetical protein
MTAPRSSTGHRPRVGVDVVSIDRIVRAGDAVTWAVREAAVKAAGGRPAGFEWASIRVSHDGRSTGELATLLGAALLEGTGRPAAGWCGYEWSPPLPGAHGTAAWCADDNAIWTIAVSGTGAGSCDYGSW